MKLLAQFYACLAIIVVFTAVFSGIEAARSTDFMAANVDSRRGWLATEPEQKSPKEGLTDGAIYQRMRRAATVMTEEKPDEKPKQHDEEPPKGPPKVRRHATEAPEPQKQTQADEAPEQEQKRNRRQAPPGMPNPQDMAKQMPMPPQGK